METTGKTFKTPAVAAAILLAAAVSAFGAPVGFERARGVALNHLERTRGGKVKPAQGLPKKTGAAAPYHVFEKENGGFVIVSGDDIAMPVLGETDSGVFDGDSLPPALLWLLGTYERQINEAAESGAAQDGETKKLWEQAALTSVLSASSYPEKLLSTTWNQNAPYNLLCPMDGGKRSVTGCVATAMAQIMKYWRHPANGTGASEAYRTTTKKISVPSVNLNTAYDYASMLDNYTVNGGTSVQRDAVSKLMYHCGVSVKMDYENDGSGAKTIDAAAAMTQNFGYDSSLRFIYSLNSGGISAGDWKDLVIGQIENNSPVYYDGVDTVETYGHAFIIDGYNDVTGMFHINWGWGGRSDGFFQLTALNPETSSGVLRFNDKQGMIINIMPNQGGSPPSQIKVSRFNVSTTPTGVSADIRAKMNYGADFSGKIGLAVMSGNSVAAVLDSANYSISNTYKQQYGQYTVNYKDAALNGRFGAGMPSGAVVALRAVTKRGAGAWAPVGETRMIATPPPPPTAASVTYDAITLTAVSGYEYSIGGAEWRKSHVFGGLMSDTKYTFYQRVAATRDADASAASAGLEVKTDQIGKVAIGGFAGDNPRVGDVLTASLVSGYDIGALTYTWKVNGAAVGSGNSYTVGRSNLTYNITLEITSNAERETVLRASTGPALKMAAPPAPGAPAAASVTDSGVTLAVTSGYEYSMDRAAWRIDGAFGGLAPNTGYTFYQRAAETKDAYASAASAGLTVSTGGGAPISLTPPTVEPKREAVLTAPDGRAAGVFTAGPNPVAKSSGAVSFYRLGGQAVSGELRVYDIAGNVINRIKISDMAIDNQLRRKVGSWDLTGGDGRPVPDGAYLVRGAIRTSDGKTEKISLVLSVR